MDALLGRVQSCGANRASMPNPYPVPAYKPHAFFPIADLTPGQETCVGLDAVHESLCLSLPLNHEDQNILQDLGRKASLGPADTYPQQACLSGGPDPNAGAKRAGTKHCNRLRDNVRLGPVARLASFPV